MNFYRHVLDVRLGDIDFLWGKLKLVRLVPTSKVATSISPLRMARQDRVRR